MKEGTVRKHQNDRGECELKLKRSLFRQSEQVQLDDLVSLIENVRLVDEGDIREWKWKKNKMFSVKSCYKYFVSRTQPRSPETISFPFKFTWEPRIPTNIWESLIESNNAVCNRVTNWSSLKMVLSQWPIMYMGTIKEKIWAILPYAVVWSLWNLRNNAIFKDGEVVVVNEIRKLKGLIWSWLNMDKKTMELRESICFLDLILHWAVSTGSNAAGTGSRGCHAAQEGSNRFYLMHNSSSTESEEEIMVQQHHQHSPPAVPTQTDIRDLEAGHDASPMQNIADGDAVDHEQMEDTVLDESMSITINECPICWYLSIGIKFASGKDSLHELDLAFVPFLAGSIALIGSSLPRPDEIDVEITAEDHQAYVKVVAANGHDKSNLIEAITFQYLFIAINFAFHKDSLYVIATAFVPFLAGLMALQWGDSLSSEEKNQQAKIAVEARN
ncbi:hypothetical protein FRX31_004963 [Thalictrum thalictroides]|uniref:Uncharacterized protein n=1 Tax=Thalictrum thalictroides TaxID=46969 RepID=A0A7J6X6Z0_THATH|nr:hypothetical protein FRX31_004963 [Thalictrum thalictroides]